MCDFTLINVISGFLLINSIYWGFFSHNDHCNLLGQIGVKCLSHNFHLFFSVLFFVSALVLVQRKHLSTYLPFLGKL